MTALGWEIDSAGWRPFHRVRIVMRLPKPEAPEATLRAAQMTIAHRQQYQAVTVFTVPPRPVLPEYMDGGSA